MIDFSKQTLLVIAPHPDDEVLGCAGLIDKVKKYDGKVYVLIVTVGNLAQLGGNKSDMKIRAREVADAMKILRVDGFEIGLVGKKYHMKLDTISQMELVNLIESKSSVSLDRVRPSIVCFPYIDSYNQDHRAVAQAAFSALRPRPKKYRHLVPMALMYEHPDMAWSISSFKPNCIVDISGNLDNKIEALQKYKSQQHKDPHIMSAENVRRIAQIRGSEIGVSAGEAFMQKRLII